MAAWKLIQTSKTKHKQINNSNNKNLFPDRQPSNLTPRTFGREIRSP